MELKSLSEPQKIVFDFLLDSSEFERFTHLLQANQEVRDYLTNALTTNILSSNYASSEVVDLLHNHVETKRDLLAFEQYRVTTILQRLTKMNKQFIPALYKSYDLYADGYYFMETVGVQYGLSFSNTYFDYYQWEKLPKEKKLKTVKKIFPSVSAEAQKILACLEKDRIQILGKKDKEGLYKFVDNRSDFEHLSTFEQYTFKPRKSKWPILFKLVRRKLSFTQMRRK